MFEKLKKNNKIIINTDLDGILSGIFLHHFSNCEIVGFSNSTDSVWVDETKCKSIFDAVYIDLFVLNPNVICIDQHIVSINKEHHELLLKNDTKINPNLDNPHFHLPNDSYFSKYPFGTIHYIIAQLEKENINLSNFDYNKTIENLNFKDYLLRADDAMKTTIDSKYIENAQYWWKWLYQFSNNSKIIRDLTYYLVSLNPEKVTTIKTEISKKLKTSFGCDSSDGGIKEIGDTNHKIKESAKNYFRFIANSCGLSCFDLDLNLTKISGTNKRISLTEIQKIDLIEQGKINNEIVFSYAFVRSSNRESNFSYTVLNI
jgi:hypothetical protein